VNEDDYKNTFFIKMYRWYLFFKININDFEKYLLDCTFDINIYPLTCRGPVSDTQIIDTIVFLIPRGELKGGYMYLSPVAPHNRL